MNTSYKIKLKKNDVVIVISGKYKGKTGKVLTTFTKTNKALILLKSTLNQLRVYLKVEL